MKFDRARPLKIILLGAGGTGGHAAPHLYRMCCTLNRPVRILIVDGDMVSEKNLIRQNFCRQDLGKNKAEVIAKRYAAAFGVKAEYYPDFIEKTTVLKQLVSPIFIWHEGKMLREEVILIGAVDNNKSRILCDEVFQSQNDLIYIDSGNDKYRGQVICGIRKNGKTYFDPLSSDHPELFSRKGRFPSERSCAQEAVSSPQSIAANITAATIIIDMVYNIAIRGELKTREVNFSTISVHTKPSEQPKNQRRASA